MKTSAILQKERGQSSGTGCWKATTTEHHPVRGKTGASSPPSGVPGYSTHWGQSPVRALLPPSHVGPMGTAAPPAWSMTKCHVLRSETLWKEGNIKFCSFPLGILAKVWKPSYATAAAPAHRNKVVLLSVSFTGCPPHSCFHKWDLTCARYISRWPGRRRLISKSVWSQSQD